MFTEECSYAGGDAAAFRPEPSDVLIVEDEHVARRALGALLSASGYRPEAAESAEQALDLLKRKPAPRVALVDLNLPGMSGVDFIHELEQINPSVQAVLMTGAGDETLAAALRERYIPYVRKPVDFSRLLSVIGDPSCQ
jgi:two-component system C4-dicarboxylate transport response regulator DctD